MFGINLAMGLVFPSTRRNRDDLLLGEHNTILRNASLKCLESLHEGFKIVTKPDASYRVGKISSTASTEFSKVNELNVVTRAT